MKMIAWLMLAAAIVPFLSAILARRAAEVRQQRPASLAGGRKAGGRAPTRRRAMPSRRCLFYAAVLFALQPGRRDARGHADGVLAGAATGLSGHVRGGLGALRSLVWATSIGFTIAILFTGVEPAAAPPGAPRRRRGVISTRRCGAGALDGDLAFLRLALVGGRHLVSPAGSFTSMYGPSDVARSTGLPWPSCMATVTSAT